MSTAILSVPPINPDESANDYEYRVFGLVRDEVNHGDDPFGRMARLTFADGTVIDQHPGGVADVVSSIQAGRDEEFTAYCENRSWFIFRTGDVTGVEAVAVGKES